jgi:diacylglycerol kinase family enzyme
MQMASTPGKALLVINTKSGRNHDSILYIRELVQLLQRRGISVDVRVKLSKAQALREAKAAARRGCELVVAAGGDGTVEAVARGLVGSRTALGIIALGTYNNVAASLGVPAACDQAVALIASGAARLVDVGEVTVHGKRRSHMFLEFATVGLGAALMPVGQDLEKHRWRAAMQQLPALMTQAPARVDMQLDETPRQQIETMLLTISNAPALGGWNAARSGRAYG